MKDHSFTEDYASKVFKLLAELAEECDSFDITETISLP